MKRPMKAKGIMPGSGPITDDDVTRYMAAGAVETCAKLRERLVVVESIALVALLLAVGLALRARRES